MKLSNNAYDFLKFMGTILLPALAVFYTSVATIWGLPFGDEIPKTIMAVDLLLNTCLGLSTANYYKEIANTKEADAELPVVEDKVM